MYLCVCLLEHASVSYSTGVNIHCILFSCFTTNLSSVVIENGSLRFNNSTQSHHSGLVEAYSNGNWSNVCHRNDPTFTYLCNQMGFAEGSRGDPRLIDSGESLRTDWDKNDLMCSNRRYGTDGCLWYTPAIRCHNKIPQVMCTGMELS